MVSPNTLRIQGKNQPEKKEPPQQAVDKNGRPLAFRNGVPVIFGGKILSRNQRRLMIKKHKQRTEGKLSLRVSNPTEPVNSPPHEDADRKPGP